MMNDSQSVIGNPWNEFVSSINDDCSTNNVKLKESRRLLRLWRCQNFLLCKLCDKLVINSKFVDHYASRHDNTANSYQPQVSASSDCEDQNKTNHHKTSIHKQIKRYKRNKKKRVKLKSGNTTNKRVTDEYFDQKQTKLHVQNNKCHLKSSNKNNSISNSNINNKRPRSIQMNTFCGDKKDKVCKKRKMDSLFCNNIITPVASCFNNMNDEDDDFGHDHDEDNFYSIDCEQSTTNNKNNSRLLTKCEQLEVVSAGGVGDVGSCYNDHIYYCSNDSVNRISSDSSTPPSLSLGGGSSTLQTLSSPSGSTCLQLMNNEHHYHLPSSSDTNHNSRNLTSSSCKYQIDSLPWENMPFYECDDDMEEGDNSISVVGESVTATTTTNTSRLLNKSIINDNTIICDTNDDGGAGEEVERAVQSITGLDMLCNSIIINGSNNNSSNNNNSSSDNNVSNNHSHQITYRSNDLFSIPSNLLNCLGKDISSLATSTSASSVVGAPPTTRTRGESCSGFIGSTEDELSMIDDSFLDEIVVGQSSSQLSMLPPPPTQSTSSSLSLSFSNPQSLGPNNLENDMINSIIITDDDNSISNINLSTPTTAVATSTTTNNNNIFNTANSSDYDEKFEALINSALCDFVNNNSITNITTITSLSSSSISSNSASSTSNTISFPNNTSTSITTNISPNNFKQRYSVKPNDNSKCFDPLNHCGVVESNGSICCRGLLCKHHTMSQKRLVQRPESISSLIKAKKAKKKPGVSTPNKTESKDNLYIKTEAINKDENAKVLLKQKSISFTNIMNTNTNSCIKKESIVCTTSGYLQNTSKLNVSSQSFSPLITSTLSLATQQNNCKRPFIALKSLLWNDITKSHDECKAEINDSKCLLENSTTSNGASVCNSNNTNFMLDDLVNINGDNLSNNLPNKPIKSTSIKTISTTIVPSSTVYPNGSFSNVSSICATNNIVNSHVNMGGNNFMSKSLRIGQNIMNDENCVIASLKNKQSLSCYNPSRATISQEPAQISLNRIVQPQSQPTSAIATNLVGQPAAHLLYPVRSLCSTNTHPHHGLTPTGANSTPHIVMLMNSIPNTTATASQQPPSAAAPPISNVNADPPRPVTVHSSTPQGITQRFIILPDGTISAATTANPQQQYHIIQQHNHNNNTNPQFITMSALGHQQDLLFHKPTSHIQQQHHPQSFFISSLQHPNQQQFKQPIFVPSISTSVSISSAASASASSLYNPTHHLQQYTHQQQQQFHPILSCSNMNNNIITTTSSASVSLSASSVPQQLSHQNDLYSADSSIVTIDSQSSTPVKNQIVLQSPSDCESISGGSTNGSVFNMLTSDINSQNILNSAIQQHYQQPTFITSSSITQSSALSASSVTSSNVPNNIILRQPLLDHHHQQHHQNHNHPHQHIKSQHGSTLVTAPPPLVISPHHFIQHGNGGGSLNTARFIHTKLAQPNTDHDSSSSSSSTHLMNNQIQNQNTVNSTLDDPRLQHNELVIMQPMMS